MKRNMSQWIEELKASPAKKPLPVLSFPGIQLLGTTVRELVSNGELQARCMKAVADRYDTAASVSNMDLSVEAEAFGARVIFSDEDVPTVIGRLVDTEEDADKLEVPRVGKARTGEYIKAIQHASELITDRPVLAGVIGPYSLAGRLMEMTEIMIKCLTEPEVAHKVLKKVTGFIISYIEAFKKAGANGIVMAEPAAGLLSPSLCSEFSSAYVKTIIDAVETDDFIVVYHNCGNTVPLVESIRATGARAVHLGNSVRLADVIALYPPHVLVMGNIDPASEFLGGSAESITKAARALLEDLDRYPNWVISSGCDIPPLTPLANIDAFFLAVDEYYAEKYGEPEGSSSGERSRIHWLS